jgi:anti-anti-sigma factor
MRQQSVLSSWEAPATWFHLDPAAFVGMATLEGEVDASNAHELAVELEELADRAGWCICLDVADLDFIDAAGLRVLAEVAVACAERGGRLELDNPRPLHARMLARCGDIGLV